MNTSNFDYERLDAYKLARAGIRELRPVLKGIPRGNADVLDQLKRASLSVCLNIAEGAGAWLPPEKARFYRIARASATECIAVLDYIVDAGLTDQSHVDPAKNTYSRVIATLVRLAQYTESTHRPATSPSTTPAPSGARVWQPTPKPAPKSRP
jgi:four helix bundle protein